MFDISYIMPLDFFCILKYLYNTHKVKSNYRSMLRQCFKVWINCFSLTLLSVALSVKKLIKGKHFEMPLSTYINVLAEFYFYFSASTNSRHLTVDASCRCYRQKIIKVLRILEQKPLLALSLANYNCYPDDECMNIFFGDWQLLRQLNSPE